MVNEQDQYEVELVRIMEDGRGVAWAPDGTLLLIDNVRQTDGLVSVIVNRVYHETAFCKATKSLGQSTTPESRHRTVDTPYEIEDDDEDDEDDEDFDDED